MSLSESPLDTPEVKSFIEQLIKDGEFNAAIARALWVEFEIETSEASIRRFRKRHELNIPGADKTYTKIEGDKAECVTPRVEGMPVLDDPDTMLRQRGLSPEDWYIDAITVNEWDGPKSGGSKVTYYQAKFTAKRKRPLGIMPVRSDGYVFPDIGRRKIADNPELVVICGDQQAPFHDRRLHELFLQWLEINQPDRGVVLGDLGDYPDISRHPSDPENQALVNECLQDSYDILRDYRSSSLVTEWDYLLGNHDERIRQYILKNSPAIYSLSTVDTEDAEGQHVFNLGHLLRLDELGVNLIEPHGTYEWAQVELSDKLAVRHGWIARKGSGASALTTLEQTGYSIIMGHTHRQSVVHKSQPEIDGVQRTTVAVEAGCMCRIDARGEFDEKGRRFPNYGSGHADWQRGFVTATIWPDGMFKIDLASYVNGVLIYGSQRYE